MKIAVLGAGISGLGAAYMLSRHHTVDVYEKEHRLGGHARTTMVSDEKRHFGVDTGFLVFNHPTYPLLTELFRQLEVKIEKSDMSFGFWDSVRNIAYNGQTLGGLFFQKKLLFSPSHYRMIFDILRFNKNALYHLEHNDSLLDTSLGEYLQSYSKPFKERYLLPMGASIWSTPTEEMLLFPARTFLTFFKNHGLLGVSTQHQWLTVSGGSISYVHKIAAKISGTIFKNSTITGVRRLEHGVELLDKEGKAYVYDKVVLAMHAPDALSLLLDPTKEEQEILGAFTYMPNDAVLHNDTGVLYPNEGIYAAWNYKTQGQNRAVTLSYWLNRLQNLSSKKHYFVSLNETQTIANPIERITFEHPQFDTQAIQAQTLRHKISGRHHTYYAGAYWRYGFHEDGLWSAQQVALALGCDL